jgi:hypothetical protein
MIKAAQTGMCRDGGQWTSFLFDGVKCPICANIPIDFKNLRQNLESNVRTLYTYGGWNLFRSLFQELHA